MEFGYESFARLLDRVLAAGYRFRRLDEVEGAPTAPLLLLRHDVDISPIAARRLGSIEAARGVCASYFFQLDAGTYSPFAAETLETIRELRAQGHAVGLHIDQRLIGADEAPVARTLEWFSTCVTPLDRVVSFHRPGPTVLGRQYATFVSAYQPSLFSETTYLSDSRRSLEFWPRLEAWLDERRPRIQLLLHPEWWPGTPSMHAFWADLGARRHEELRAFMAANYPRVFGGIIEPPPERTFEL